MSRLRSLKQKYDEPVREYRKRQLKIIVNLARHGYEVSPIDELTSFEQGLLEPALKHLRQVVVKAKAVKEALSATEAFEEANPTYNKKTEFHKTNFLVRENIAIGQNPNLQDDFARMRSPWGGLPSQRERYANSANFNRRKISQNVQCRRCQRVGNVERECPSPPDVSNVRNPASPGWT